MQQVADGFQIILDISLPLAVEHVVVYAIDELVHSVYALFVGFERLVHTAGVRELGEHLYDVHRSG